MRNKVKQTRPGRPLVVKGVGTVWDDDNHQQVMVPDVRRLSRRTLVSLAEAVRDTLCFVEQDTLTVAGSAAGLIPRPFDLTLHPHPDADAMISSIATVCIKYGVMARPLTRTEKSRLK